MSYRSRDPVVLQASMQQHRRGRSLSSSTSVNERDEDLVLFHEMQKRERERERRTHSGNAPAAAPNSIATASLCRIPSSTISKSRVADDIFTSDWDKNDYDWLLTPPGTPLMAPPERDLPSLGFSLNGTPSVRSLPALKTSRLGTSRSEPLSRAEPSSKVVRGNLALHLPANPSVSLSGSTMTASRRSVSLGSSTFPRPSLSGSTSVGRPSTPTSIRSSKASAITEAPRPSSSTSNSGARPSTPSGRPSIPPSNRSTSSSRPSTPVRRPPTPTRQSNPPNTLTRSSSVSKASSLPSKSAVSSRPSSPVARNRGLQPSALPGFSQEPPPNLRTSVPERSISNSRGSTVGSRPGGSTAARTTQAETPDAGARNRWQSSSPLRTRGRLSSDHQNGDRSTSMNGKLHDGGAGTAISTVGSKVMEKSVQLRKPVLPADDQCPVSTSRVKHPVNPTPSLREVKSTMTALRDSSGFGRNLSKKSLDMALRHMDVRRSSPGGFRSFMSNVPASSLYSVRSASVRGRSTSSTADSPMATSSNASSEHSMSIAPDPEGSELADEAVNEKGRKSSPASQPDCAFTLSKNGAANRWLDVPDYRDDEVKIMQLFKQDSEQLSGLESPLVVCHHERNVECDNFMLEPRQY